LDYCCFTACSRSMQSALISHRNLSEVSV
jgi:hypothetical protein